MAPAVAIRIDPGPSNAELGALSRAASGGSDGMDDWTPVLARSLAHLGAYDGERLVGFVNVAWDGGIHATILDTMVHPEYGRQGVGTSLVREAAKVARQRGAHWLHVDYEPHLTSFYENCGFRPTEAGLIRLR